MKKGFIGLALAVILTVAAGVAITLNSDPHPVCPPNQPCPQAPQQPK